MPTAAAVKNGRDRRTDSFVVVMGTVAVAAGMSPLGTAWAAPGPVGSTAESSDGQEPQPAVGGQSPLAGQAQGSWPESGWIDVGNSSLAPCGDEAGTCQTHLCEEANETCIISLGCLCAELHLTDPRTDEPQAKPPPNPPPPDPDPPECTDDPDCDDQDVCTQDRCVSEACVHIDQSAQCGVSDQCISRWCDPVTGCNSAWTGSTAPQCIGGGNGSGALGSGHVVFGASGLGGPPCGSGEGLLVDVDEDGMLTQADDEAEERMPGTRLRFDGDFEVLPEIPDYIGTFFELAEEHLALDSHLIPIQVAPCSPTAVGSYDLTWLSGTLRVFAHVSDDWVPRVPQPLYGFDHVSITCTGAPQTLYVQNVGHETDIYIPSTPFGYDARIPDDPYLVGLEFRRGPSGCYDRLLFHDFNIDLQIDSDNEDIIDGVHGLPDGSLEELAVEDIAPGKLVPVNYSGTVEPDNLVPVVLNITDLTDPQVQLLYDEAAIAVYDADLELVPPDEWTDVATGLMPGLGPREVGFYVEGLTMSTEPGDQTLAALVDEDDDDEPDYFDEVTLTVLNLEYGVWDTQANPELTVSADDGIVEVFAGAFLVDDVETDIDPTPSDVVPSKVRFSIVEGSGTLEAPDGTMGTTVEVETDDFAAVRLDLGHVAGTGARVEARLVEVELAGQMTSGWEGLARETTLYRVVPGRLSDVELTQLQEVLPHDGGESENTITVEASDAYGNPAADGTSLTPHFDASCSAEDPQATLVGGTGSFEVASGIYPHGQLETTIALGDELHTLTTEISAVDVSISGPSVLPHGASVVYTATVVDAYGDPLPDGTEVSCLAHRGRIGGRPSAQTWLSGGMASCTVDTGDSNPGEGMVMFSVANTNVSKRFTVQTAAGALTVQPEYETLVHDATGPGIVDVEAADGGYDSFAYETSTLVHVQGDPGEVVSVGVAASLPTALLPFEYLVAGQTADLVDDSHGTVTGGSIDTGRYRVGTASLALDGSGEVTIAGGAATGAYADVGVTLWVWLDEVFEQPLLAKDGEYEVWLNDDGTVTLLTAIDGGWESLTTTTTMSMELWHRISVRLGPGSVELSIDGNRIEATLFDARTSLAAPVVVGDGLLGNVDNLVFTDHTADGAEAVALFGLAGDDTLTLDASGYGVFEVDAGGMGALYTAAGGEDSRVRSVDVTLESQTTPGRVASTKVQTTEISIFGRVWYTAKGFVVGASPGDPVVAHGADIAASLIIWGDVRDLLVETGKLWPGGEGPDGWKVSFALAGLAAEVPGGGEPPDFFIGLAKQAAKVMPNGPMRDALIEVMLDMISELKSNPLRVIAIGTRYRRLFEQIFSAAASHPEVLTRLSTVITNKVQLDAVAKFCTQHDDALKVLGDVADLPYLANASRTVEMFAETFRAPMRPGLMDELFASPDAVAGLARSVGKDTTWFAARNVITGIDDLPYSYTSTRFFESMDVLHLEQDTSGIAFFHSLLNEASEYGDMRQLGFLVEATRRGVDEGDALLIMGLPVVPRPDRLGCEFQAIRGGQQTDFLVSIDPIADVGGGDVDRFVRTFRGLQEAAGGWAGATPKRLIVPKGKKAELPDELQQYVDELSELTGLE